MSRYNRQEKSQRKHPVASSSSSLIKAPVVPANPKERPGWKGPGFTKRGLKHSSRPVSSASVSSVPYIQGQYLRVELQQLVLDIFRNTFPICQDYDALKPTLQEVQIALSQKDFEKAFGRLDWLEAYTVRWSPNRALCCAAILVEICEEFRDEILVNHMLGHHEKAVESTSKSPETIRHCLNVVSFGGGATEVLAFGTMLRHLRPETVGKSTATILQTEETIEKMNSLSVRDSSASAVRLQLRLVDAANWSPVISALQAGLVTAPLLSKYASATKKATNASFIMPDVLNSTFQQNNVFETSSEELASILGAEPTLITLFFTLKDLHISSVSKTAAFLLKLTVATPKNSLLLVIDSVESESEASAGKNVEIKERKSYPMRYVLDMALMEKHSMREANDKLAWEKLLADESRLFKLEDGLRYSLSLENIRFQVHLFRRQ